MSPSSDRTRFMLEIGIKANLSPLHRSMIALGARQVPFAMSMALNTLARGVADDERRLIFETFDTPTPFTANAYRIEVATKTKLVAMVAAKDIQATYLAPYVVGGKRSLGSKRAMLAPRGVSLNQYGNLTRGKMRSLTAKPNVFVGKVATRSGKTISGVWQRTGTNRTRGAAKGGMKLLIQFDDTSAAPKRLPFEQRARIYIERHAAAAFTDALQRSLATARR